VGNLKFAYQTNMWGQITDFPKINNFQEWDRDDYSNAVYYLDWDKIFKYHVGTGIMGVELMMYMIPYIKRFFGSYKNFSDFAKERGIEKITSMFTFNLGAGDKRNHERILKYNQKMIDALGEMEGELMPIMPAGQYFVEGPLTDEQLQNVADLMDELGRRAKEKGITVCIHNEFWCAVNLSNHERLIEMTNPDYVSYCIDTAQLTIMGVDIVKFYEKYHDRVKHFHLKDTTHPAASDEERYGPGAEFSDDCTRWFWELGVGNVDYKSLWHSLKKYDHKGWMTIESDGSPDPLASMVLSKWYIDHELSPIYR
jgi:inosose dehydratase